MFGRTASSKPSSSLPVVGALTVLVLASMAVAIPPAAIERPAAEVECGLLVGHGRITSQLAEHAARNGYSYLAVDFTTASFDDDALWREYFTEISLRQFPIWGWIDVRDEAGTKVAQTVAESLGVSGIFVYGENAVAVANTMRESRPGLEVIAIGPRSDQGRIVDAASIGTAEIGVSVLPASSMSETQIAAARAAAKGKYLVSNVMIPALGR